MLEKPERMCRRKRVRFALEQAMKTQRGSEGIALTSALNGGGSQHHAPAALPSRESETVPVVQNGGWAPWPVWAGVENLASTGTRSPDRPSVANSYTD